MRSWPLTLLAAVLCGAADNNTDSPTAVPTFLPTFLPSYLPTFMPTFYANITPNSTNVTTELELCDPNSTDADSSVWLIGVLIAVVASVGSNLGLNFQKLTHVRIERQVKQEMEEELQSGRRNSTFLPEDLLDTVQGGVRMNHSIQSASPPGSPRTRQQTYEEELEARKKLVPYTKVWIWRLGLFLVMFSSFIDFAALAFAPQTVIAPLGSVTLVANMILAPLMFGEKNTRRDSVAVVVIIIGCVISVVFASHCDATFEPKQLFDLYSRARFLVYAAFCVIIIVVLRLAIRRYERIKADSSFDYEKQFKWHRFAVAMAAGVMGAQSLLFAKCTVELLKTTLVGKGIMFVYWQTYIVLAGLGITIFSQIKWLNQGLQDFDALYIVPVFQTFWLLTSVVAGMIFFGEYVNVFNHVANAIAFPAGVLLTIAGVMVLSQRAKHVMQAKSDPADRPNSPIDVMTRGLLDPEADEAL